MKFNRREFIKSSTIAATGISLTGGQLMANSKPPEAKKITIAEVSSDFEREPLVRPFGFKGGFMTEIWQTASWMQNNSGISKIGLCTQNVLWSDALVFAGHSESGGNALIYKRPGDYGRLRK